MHFVSIFLFENSNQCRLGYNVNVSLLAVQADWNVSAVSVGSAITFNCHVNDSDQILWQFDPPHGDEETLYINNEWLPQQFAKRSFVNFPIGTSSLTINNIQHCDAGLYVCVYDNNGSLSRCKFSLVTIGKYHALSLSVPFCFVSVVATDSIIMDQDF